MPFHGLFDFLTLGTSVQVQRFYVEREQLEEVAGPKTGTGPIFRNALDFSRGRIRQTSANRRPTLLNSGHEFWDIACKLQLEEQAADEDRHGQEMIRLLG